MNLTLTMSNYQLHCHSDVYKSENEKFADQKLTVSLSFFLSTEAFGNLITLTLPSNVVHKLQLCDVPMNYESDTVSCPNSERLQDLDFFF